MERMKKRQIVVYVLLFVLLTAAGVILYHMDIARLQTKEQALDQTKLDAVAEMVRSVQTMRNSSKASFENHLQANIRFMTAALAGDVTGEGYTGPRLFEDGAVAELQGDRVIWPEGMPENFPELTAEAIREGRRVEAEIPADGADDPSGSANTRKLIILSGRIADNWYYVDWTDEIEVPDTHYIFLRDESFLEMAKETYGGSLVVVSDDGSVSQLFGETDIAEGVSDAAALGLTPEIIAERTRNVQINGEECLCAYAEVSQGTATLIYIRPLKELTTHSLIHVSTAIISVLIILVTIIVYIFAVLQYVQTHRLPLPLANRYTPKSFRRVIIMAGITGAVVVFVITSLFQTMDALYKESLVGAKSMNSFFTLLKNMTTEWSDYDRGQEADWYVYEGKRMASLIARRPEAGSREKLREYCDILGIDYIMVFNPDGREIVSNSDYSGFTMDAGLGEDSADFRRLLKGIPSIVHGVSTDPVTGLTRQMIGVTMPSATGSGQTNHGALIMAVIPVQEPSDSADLGGQFDFLNAGDRLCFFTDTETGEILYSSDASLVGKRITECGLPEKSLQDGYTDFATVNGVDSYTTTVRQAAVTFFYIITSASLFSNTLPVSCSALIAYALLFLLFYRICLKGYDSDTFRKWTQKNGQLEDESVPEERADGDNRAARSYSELLVSNSRGDGRLNDKTPEKRAGFILKTDLLLLVLVPALLFMLSGDSSGSSVSALVNIILYGDWIRGLNLFSVCGIIIVTTLGFMLLVVCNGLLSLIAGFSGRGGETICRLLYSLLRYIVVLSILYYVFEYIGLSLSTYIASMSMISLAISLGSRDMVSDMLSGLMIIFERQFQVGDIVELDGSRGRILEIGVRSTKLLTGANDIKFISNSNIRSVVNKSRRMSAFTTEIIIVTDASLVKIEELFNRELQKIARKEKRIEGGLKLAGVTTLAGGGKSERGKKTTVRVTCECRERDLDAVRDYLSRELYLLCERENIEIGEKLI